MAATTVQGPQAYSRPPYGSFAGKPTPPVLQTRESVISGVSISGADGIYIAPFPITFLTDTSQLQKPINCVVAGQQKEPVKMAMSLDGAITGPLKGIFRE